MIRAIYGCWKGHTTTLKAKSREETAPAVKCKCGEDANLFDVMTEPTELRVVKGGKA